MAPDTMKGNETHIREAKHDETLLISSIIRDSFHNVAERFNLTSQNCPKHPSNCTEEWIKKDFARGVLYYIVENDSIPVGCVALEKANPDLFYLERLAVLPKNRQNGFGKTLVNHVLTIARDAGSKKIGIGIISEQTELKQWYQRIGFIEGETKEFSHLPFLVSFMSYEL